jgi:hypothetical protein
MALDFDSAASNRKVNHGSGATTDNIAGAAAGITVWAWIYRTSDGGNQFIITKDNSTTTGWNFMVDNASATEGRLRFIVWRTTRTDFYSVGGIVPPNTWTFVAATYDTALGTPMDLYSGALATVPTEVSGYTFTQNGSGSHGTDAASDLRVGNAQRTDNTPFRGRIARGGAIARRLTLAEIQDLWSRSRWLGTPMRANVANTFLLFDYINTSNVTDLSGNGNNGTVTSAVDADHPLFLSSLASAGVG